jgi:hypothetical protein
LAPHFESLTQPFTVVLSAAKDMLTMVTNKTERPRQDNNTFFMTNILLE